jgi:hypothetical protein
VDGRNLQVPSMSTQQVAVFQVSKASATLEGELKLLPQFRELHETRRVSLVTPAHGLRY